MARGWAWGAWRRALGTMIGAGAAFVVLAGSAGAATCLPALVACSAPETTTTSVPPPDPAPPPAPPPRQPTPDEARARLVAQVNAERVGRGLGELAVRDDVTAIARAWSDAMARAGTLSHDDAYFTADSHRRLGAQLLGENVARAPDIDVAHRALMASEHHRDNILDARFTAIGVGATFVDGTWWITEDFLQPVAAAAPRASVRRSPRPARAPRVQPAAVTTSTSVAVTPAPRAAVVVAVAAEPAVRVAVLPRVSGSPVAVAASTDPSNPPLGVVAGASALVLVVAGALARQLRRR